MREFCVVDIEWNGARDIGHGVDVLGLDVEKYGIGIEKAAHKPGTRDAIDLRPCPGHPSGPAVRITLGKRLPGDGRPAGLHESFDAAGEIARRQPVGAQQRGNALAYLMAMDAVDNHAATVVQGVRPFVG